MRMPQSQRRPGRQLHLLLQQRLSRPNRLHLVHKHSGRVQVLCAWQALAPPPTARRVRVAVHWQTQTQVVVDLAPLPRPARPAQRNRVTQLRNNPRDRRRRSCRMKEQHGNRPVLTFRRKTRFSFAQETHPMRRFKFRRTSVMCAPTHQASGTRNCRCATTKSARLPGCRAGSAEQGHQHQQQSFQCCFDASRLWSGWEEMQMATLARR
mmetsp:Transcript_18017/g.45056  ORF Transcript_18017/g.45056 Transcript_18017/m.45056 type:complete len:209 (+) Transcript_18017:836-1462(+)